MVITLESAMPTPSPNTVPVLTTDEAAEKFLGQDLSSLDFTQFKPVRLGTLPKSVRPAKR